MSKKDKNSKNEKAIKGNKKNRTQNEKNRILKPEVEEGVQYKQISSETAVEHRLKKQRLERDVRQKKIKLNRLRGILRIILIVILIYGLNRLYHCKMWYLSAYTFNSTENKSLKIVGNKITPSYKILNEMKKVSLERKPIFMIDTTELEENIKTLEPIKNVFIRRFWWPARLVVMVDEREPILSIATDEEHPPIGFFAQGGAFIGREYLPLKSSTKTFLVLSNGLSADNYRNWDAQRISMIEKVAKTIEVSSKEKIEFIDFRIPKDVYVKLQTTSLRLGEVNTTSVHRVKNIYPILEEVHKMNKPVKYIDLRWDETYYIKLE